MDRRLYRRMLISMAVWIICMAIWMTGCTTSPTSTFSASSWGTDTTSKTAFEVISKSLTDQNARARTSAIEAVATARLLNFVPQVHLLMRDPVVPVRFSALVAMGDLQYTPAQPDCQQIFSEPREDANVKLAAAYALVRMGQTGYLEPLRQGLNDTQPSVRSNAAFLIGKAGDQESLERLHQILTAPDTDEQTSRQIIDSLAQLHDNRIYKTLWAQLISLFADDRIQGIRGMGYLGHNQAQKAIATKLNDDIPEVRLAAAEELAKFGDNQGEPVIMDILRHQLNEQTTGPQADDTDRVRLYVMASMAIGRINSEPARRYLPKLLHDPSPFVRIAAAEAVLLNHFQFRR